MELLIETQHEGELSLNRRMLLRELPQSHVTGSAAWSQAHESSRDKKVWLMEA